mmetsp:Transcript_1665/g.3024  ORF Transcript_1665/g.3024 Transcript_1665/m.3024 type:complete len:327 (+) Transcript_1665:7431-8411(+)
MAFSAMSVILFPDEWRLGLFGVSFDAFRQLRPLLNMFKPGLEPCFSWPSLAPGFAIISTSSSSAWPLTLLPSLSYLGEVDVLFSLQSFPSFSSLPSDFEKNFPKLPIPSRVVFPTTSKPLPTPPSRFFGLITSDTDDAPPSAISAASGFLMNLTITLLSSLIWQILVRKPDSKSFFATFKTERVNFILSAICFASGWLLGVGSWSSISQLFRTLMMTDCKVSNFSLVSSCMIVCVNKEFTLFLRREGELPEPWLRLPPSSLLSLLLLRRILAKFSSSSAERGIFATCISSSSSSNDWGSIVVWCKKALSELSLLKRGSMKSQLVRE